MVGVRRCWKSLEDNLAEIRPIGAYLISMTRSRFGMSIVLTQERFQLHKQGSQTMESMDDQDLVHLYY